MTTDLPRTITTQAHCPGCGYTALLDMNTYNGTTATWTCDTCQIDHEVQV